MALNLENYFLYIKDNFDVWRDKINRMSKEYISEIENAVSTAKQVDGLTGTLYGKYPVKNINGSVEAIEDYTFNKISVDKNNGKSNTFVKYISSSFDSTVNTEIDLGTYIGETDSDYTGDLVKVANSLGSAVILNRNDIILNKKSIESNDKELDEIRTYLYGTNTNVEYSSITSGNLGSIKSSIEDNKTNINDTLQYLFGSNTYTISEIPKIYSSMISSKAVNNISGGIFYNIASSLINNSNSIKTNSNSIAENSNSIKANSDSISDINNKLENYDNVTSTISIIKSSLYGNNDITKSNFNTISFDTTNTNTILYDVYNKANTYTDNVIKSTSGTLLSKSSVESAPTNKTKISDIILTASGKLVIKSNFVEDKIKNNIKGNGCISAVTNNNSNIITIKLGSGSGLTTSSNILNVAIDQINSPLIFNSNGEISINSSLLTTKYLNDYLTTDNVDDTSIIYDSSDKKLKIKDTYFSNYLTKSNINNNSTVILDSNNKLAVNITSLDKEYLRIESLPSASTNDGNGCIYYSVSDKEIKYVAPTKYTLTSATSNTLGGVIIPDSSTSYISNINGSISVSIENLNNEYLRIKSLSTKYPENGGIYYSDSDKEIKYVAPTGYELTPATSDTLGGVIIPDSSTSYISNINGSISVDINSISNNITTNCIKSSDIDYSTLQFNTKNKLEIGDISSAVISNVVSLLDDETIHYNNDEDKIYVSNDFAKKTNITNSISGTSINDKGNIVIDSKIFTKNYVSIDNKTIKLDSTNNYIFAEPTLYSAKSDGGVIIEKVSNNDNGYNISLDTNSAFSLLSSCIYSNGLSIYTNENDTYTNYILYNTGIIDISTNDSTIEYTKNVITSTTNSDETITYSLKPVTSTLIINNAVSATNDGSGNDITSTYVASIGVSGTTVTYYDKTSNPLGSFTTQDTNTDTLVTQTVTTTSAEYPLLFKNTASSATVTDTARFGSTITANPKTGTITASIFKGDLIGTASSATICPYYLPLSGGTMNGSINIDITSLTSTYLGCLQGKGVINQDTGSAGVFLPILNYKTTSGVIGFGGYQGNLQLFYATSATVTNKSITMDKMVTLMNESGNGSWAGTITASSGFIGNLTGLATSATNDAGGNDIRKTYVSSIGVSGTKVTYYNKSGTAIGSFTTQDTDTHYSATLKVGTTSKATTNATTTNTTTYLNLVENDTIRDSHQIVGSGGVTVSADSSGKINISAIDINTWATFSTASATGSANTIWFQYI